MEKVISVGRETFKDGTNKGKSAEERKELTQVRNVSSLPLQEIPKKCCWHVWWSTAL